MHKISSNLDRRKYWSLISYELRSLSDFSSPLPSIPLLSHRTAHIAATRLPPCNCVSITRLIPMCQLGTQLLPAPVSRLAFPSAETLLCVSLLIFWFSQVVSRNSFSLLNRLLSSELVGGEAANCQTNGQPDCTSRIFSPFYAQSTNETSINMTTRICSQIAVADNWYQ